MIPKRIGVLGFDGVASIDIAGPIQAFAAARAAGDLTSGTACYEVILIGAAGKTFTSDAGINFKAHTTIANAPALDTIVVPGGAASRDERQSSSMSAWLAAQASHTRRIAAVCTGVYALAETGLLDHRNVTTHWRFARNLAQRFPRLKVNSAASFVKDGQFFSCASPSAALEMTLALIEEDFGSRVALGVARDLVIHLRPSTANDQAFDPADYQSGPAQRLAELPAWVRGHLQDNLSVELLAERACVCPRHFSRLFKRAFDRTPGEFVEDMRLSEAQQYLAQQRHSIEHIALAVGFKSGDAFRRAFERRLGLNPSKYRQQMRTRNSRAATHRHDFSLTQKAA